MTDFWLNVDDDRTPKAALDVAGQGVRSFNHRSHVRFSDTIGWTYPSDGYRALGEITYLLGGLAQALTHISESIEGSLNAGELGLDVGETVYGGNAAAAVADCRDALAAAGRQLGLAHGEVSKAQSAISRAHYIGPDPEEE